MIAASELRIGNYLLSSFQPGLRPILKVVGIIGASVYMQSIYDKKTQQLYYEDVEAIPLTPEILQKSGFVKHEDRWLMQTGFTCGIKQHMNHFDFYIKDNYIVGFKYLHELQNLFHAMTREDLQIIL